MGLINLHTHSACIDKEITVRSCQPHEMAELHHEEYTYLTVGIHPWYIDNKEESYHRLEEAISNEKVIMIGECGLDKVWGPTLDIQEASFRRHIELSEKHQKPLIIHCVKAYNEIIAIKRELKPKQAWILHGFNSTMPIMEEAFNAGFYFSFGKAVLNPNSKASHIIKEVPVNHIFLETDDSAYDIRQIYQKVADFKGVHITQLKSIIQDNFNKIIKK